MASENQSETDTSPTVGKPVVGTVAKKRFKLPGFKKFISKKNLLIAAVALVLIAGTIGLYMQLGGKNYAIKVNGKEYSKTEVETYIKPIMEISQKSEAEATDLLYQTLINIEVAKSLGLEPSDEAVEAEFSVIPGVLGQSDPEKAWLKLAAKNSIIERSFADKKQNNTGAEGYSYIFRFGENIENSPDYKAPGFGNQVLIERDRQYAKTKADEYHAKLTNKTITPEQALAEIRADGRLGYAYTPNSGKSARFSPLDNQLLQARNKRQLFTPSDTQLLQTVYHKEVIETIASQKNTGLTAVSVGKTSSVENADSPDDFDETFYYFVLLEKVSQTSQDFAMNLENTMQKINSNSEKRTF